MSGVRADNAIRRHPDIAHDPRASPRAAGTHGTPVLAAHVDPDDTPILGHLAQIRWLRGDKACSLIRAWVVDLSCF